MPQANQEPSIYAIVDAWLVLLFVVGLVLATWWLGLRGQRLLPPRRNRVVPWSLIEVVIAAFLAILFWPQIIYLILTTIFSLATGLEVPLDPAASAPHGAHAGTVVSKSVGLVLSLIAQGISFPLTFISIPIALRGLSGTRPYQLGLTLWHWWPNVVLGCIGWIILTPVADGVQFIANVAEVWLTGQEPAEHPLVQTLMQNPSAAMWGLIAFLTILGAPAVEELLFRGVFQRWLCRDGRRANIAVLIAVTISALIGVSSSDLGWMVFAALILVVDVFFADLARPWLPEKQAARGVYATAVIFGLSHYPIWPTPVPLTVLGLGLGWLAYRTQSLVPSMVAHGLFNAVTMLSFAFPSHV